MNTDQNLFEEFPPVSREEWEKVIQQDLRGGDYRTKLKWETGEGVEALPFYRRDDVSKQSPPLRSTRQSWEIRQIVTEQEIETANRIALKALTSGADSVSFQMNIDLSATQTGGTAAGTGIREQDDMRRLLSDIAITQNPLHFECGPAAPVILAMLGNEVKRRGVRPSEISGTVLFDPWAHAITSGRLPAERETVIQQMYAFCEANLPAVKCMGIDARAFHETGGTIVQEVAYALAAGSEYLAMLTNNGYDADEAADAIHFTFSVGSSYFLEISKFRAVRTLWKKILKAYKADPVSGAYIHGTSSCWNKTLYDPYVNMLRTTTEGMSAAVAGCDAVTLQPYDDCFGEPDDFSRRIARNSQIILKEEAHFDKVSDPAAGSYYIETLTDKIAAAAWNSFRKVEEQGGMTAAICDGTIQQAIEESQAARTQAIATRNRIFVGTNKYPDTNNVSSSGSRERPSASELMESNYRGSINRHELFLSLQKALKENATLGDLLPAIFTWDGQTVQKVEEHRGAEGFESLRKQTEEQEHTPQVLTLPMGDKKMRKARSAFTTNFFGCAGYEITDPIGFERVEDAISEIGKQQPDIAVLCSSDPEYRNLVPDICEKLTGLDGKPIMVLAGYPEDYIEQYRKAGIDCFIHAKSNILDTLTDFQKRLGISQDSEITM